MPLVATRKPITPPIPMDGTDILSSAVLEDDGHACVGKFPHLAKRPRAIDFIRAEPLQTENFRRRHRRQKRPLACGDVVRLPAGLERCQQRDLLESWGKGMDDLTSDLDGIRWGQREIGMEPCDVRIPVAGSSNAKRPP